MRKTILRALLVTTLPALAAAQPRPAPTAPQKTRVAVLDLRAIGVEAAKAELLSEIALSEAAALPYLEVIGRSDIQAMLGFEKQKKMLGCEEDSACIAEIGGALGVKLVLVGSVGKLGNLYRLDLKVLDTAKAGSVRRFGLNVEGAEEKMVAGVQTAVRTLFATEANAAGASSAAQAAQPVPASIPPAGTAVTTGTPQVAPPGAAPYKRVLLGMRLAYAKPGGDLNANSKMSEWVETVGMFQLEGAVKLGPRFSVGAFFSFGSANPGDTLSGDCDLPGVKCTITVARLGLDAAYDFTGPTSRFVPWAGVGVGFELIDVKEEAPDGTGVTFSASGWEPFRMQAGLDARLGSFRVGPYLAWGVAKYSQAEYDFTDIGGDAGSGSYEGKTHSFGYFGLRGGLEL